MEVSHNTDGSKSVSIEVTGNRFSKCFFYTAKGGTDGGNGWGATGSKTVALTTIPRASTIGASDANIGSKSTIVVTQKSTAYTHSIAYKFGSLTGYVTASGGVSSTEVKYSTTSISWTIPTTFYAQIPNAKTGTCTLTIKTYSGSTQIGDAKTDTFTVTAAQSLCAPSVSGSVVDSNATTKALTGDERKLVRYYSTALCTITATAKNSATISAKKIGGTTVSGTTRSIAKVEVDSVSFYAKDSRGYEASTDVEFTLVPYVILTNNSSGQRTDPTSGNAKLTIKGDYFNGSFGSVSNALTVKYRFREVGGTYGSYTTVTPTISGNSYTVTLSLSGLDYEHSYEFEVVVSDKLATVTKVVTIKQGIPVFDWGKADFQFHVPVFINGNMVDAAEVLFESSEVYGDSGDVELTQAVSNFEFIEVFFNDNNGRGCNSVRIYNPEGKQFCPVAIEPNGSGAMYIRRSGYTISGATITYAGNGGYAYFSGSSWTTYTGNFIRISRVVGHNRTTAVPLAVLTT